MQQGHDMSWNLRCLGKWFIFHVIFVPQLRSTPRLPKPRRNKSLQSFIDHSWLMFIVQVQSANFSANYSPSYRMISVSVSSSPAFPTSLWNRPRGNCHDCLPITSRVCTKHYWTGSHDGWWWLMMAHRVINSLHNPRVQYKASCHLEIWSSQTLPSHCQLVSTAVTRLSCSPRVVSRSTCIL